MPNAAVRTSAPPADLAESLRRAAARCKNARLRRVLLALADGEQAQSDHAAGESGEVVR
jgi:hypothetical protein